MEGELPRQRTLSERIQRRFREETDFSTISRVGVAECGAGMQIAAPSRNQADTRIRLRALGAGRLT